MKTLKSILASVALAAFITVGFASCAEEEVMPVRKIASKTASAQEHDDAWD